MPPWIHSAFARSDSSASSGLSSMLTAPGTVWPVTGRPWSSSSGVEASVVMGVVNGSVTIERAPQGPVTARLR